MARTRASSLAKVRDNWTEKHRNVARKIFLEGGWTQKRLFGIDWSDTSQCLQERGRNIKKHRLYHSPKMYEVRREIPEVFRKLEQKARTSKKEWKWQRGIVEHPFSGNQWSRGHFKGTLTAPCWGTMASGEHVVGQRCSWIMMEGRGLAWDAWLSGGRVRGPAHHQEGVAEDL